MDEKEGNKTEDLKNKLEAILFSAGRKVTLDELAVLSGVDSTGLIQQTLKELRDEYDERGSPLLLIAESDGWKITVKESYLPYVQKINPHTELSKQAIETLAIVAWKQPILQADIIKVRTTAAYDHIKELEEMGFITKTKSGRTYSIRVTPKFNDYFDLPNRPGAIKEVFEDIPAEEVDAAIQRLLEKHGEAEDKGQQKLGKMDIYQAVEKGEEGGIRKEEVIPLEIYEEVPSKKKTEAAEDEEEPLIAEEEPSEADEDVLEELTQGEEEEEKKENTEPPEVESPEKENEEENAPQAFAEAEEPEETKEELHAEKDDESGGTDNEDESDTDKTI